MPPSAERIMSSLQQQQHEEPSSSPLRSIMIGGEGRNGSKSKSGLAQQQQQQQQAHHRKGLSFSEDVTIYEIERTVDMTSNEIKSTWYNRDEYFKIRHAYEKIIDKMEKYGSSGNNAKQMDESKYCTVGLQRMTSHEESKCASRRKHAYKAIQVEQQLQKEENVCDPQRLAEVYSESTTHSTNQMVATMSAIRLANDVAKYQSEPVTEDKDSSSSSSTNKGSSSKRRISQMFKIKRISTSQRGF